MDTLTFLAQGHDLGEHDNNESTYASRGCPVCYEVAGDDGRPMPEWRRRSLQGRNRFDAVSDMTDRVAGR
jgi:hypothetical protein